jgi:hypothetical protein
VEQASWLRPSASDNQGGGLTPQTRITFLILGPRIQQARLGASHNLSASLDLVPQLAVLDHVQQEPVSVAMGVLPTGRMLHVTDRAQVIPQFACEGARIVQHLNAFAELAGGLPPISELLGVFQVRTLSRVSHCRGYSSPKKQPRREEKRGGERFVVPPSGGICTEPPEGGAANGSRPLLPQIRSSKRQKTQLVSLTGIADTHAGK